MKKQIFLYLLSIFISCPVGADSIDDLVRREGVYYMKFSDVPFTGEINEGLFRGNLDKGQLQGLWHRYHPNGQLQSRGKYLNGRQHGPWETFHENGNRMERGYYEQGIRNDLWTIYMDSGHEESYEMGKYEKGVRVGLWFKHDKLLDPSGPYVIWHYDNGQIASTGYQMNGIKNGWWEYYFKDGSTQGKGRYQNNLREGWWVEFNSDGTKNIDGTGTFKDGIKVSD